MVARGLHRRTHSPAVRALEVDARNDVLVGVVALGGFFAARYGSVGWDAWLAMPIACWIGASGIGIVKVDTRDPERARTFAS